MSNTTGTCKNCGAELHGVYCSDCGQKVAHRLDAKHIFHEAVHVFTHADKGIFSLIPAVLLRPGTLALEYVQGKRKKYFNFFQYLLIIVGVVTFIMSKIHFMEHMMHSFTPGNAPPVSPRIQEVQSQVVSLLQHYLNLFLFALIPVFSFFSWLLFRRKGYNYAENFVLQVVIQAQINTLTLLVTMPFAAAFGTTIPKFIFPIAFLILLTSHTISNRQFFKTSWITAALKGLLIYAGTMLVQIVIVLIVILALASGTE